MTRISVFTPSHNPVHLETCYRSLAAQTFTDWEWVVLLNGKTRTWSPSEADSRVRVHRASSTTKGIGALKREACALAEGEILVELDHDDVLSSDALAAVDQAFRDTPGAVLVFSDFAQIDEAGEPEFTRFDEASGWSYDTRSVDGRDYLVCNALEPSPHNVGLIWFAPNHVRAFLRSAYEAIGGYDVSLSVLDDQDLMIRLFLIGDFARIPRCLYLQRWHAKNTQRDPKTNAFIQSETVRMYFDAIEPLCLAWTFRRGLRALSLTTPTSVGATLMSAQAGVETMLIDPLLPRLEAADDSVGVIEAYDILQRVPDRAAFLNECYRVLVHGGMLLTTTPSTDGRGAWQDPSHVAFYNENSFRYLTDLSVRQTIPDLTARLQVSQVRSFFPSPEHERLLIPYVQANLLAVKTGPRQGGHLNS
ncbi:MAG: hypothetical protein QOJ92_2889 [Frankiales bacterium]|nr:hypothetical protein [Frankiales bacterium]